MARCRYDIFDSFVLCSYVLVAGLRQPHHPVLCPEGVGLCGSLGSVESVPCSCPCSKKVTDTGEKGRMVKERYEQE